MDFNPANFINNPDFIYFLKTFHTLSQDTIGTTKDIKFNANLATRVMHNAKQRTRKTALSEKPKLKKSGWSTSALLKKPLNMTRMKTVATICNPIDDTLTNVTEMSPKKLESVSSYDSLFREEEEDFEITDESSFILCS